MQPDKKRIPRFSDWELTTPLAENVKELPVRGLRASRRIKQGHKTVRRSRTLRKVLLLKTKVFPEEPDKASVRGKNLQEKRQISTKEVPLFRFFADFRQIAKGV